MPKPPALEAPKKKHKLNENSTRRQWGGNGKQWEATKGDGRQQEAAVVHMSRAVSAKARRPTLTVRTLLGRAVFGNNTDNVMLQIIQIILQSF